MHGMSRAGVVPPPAPADLSNYLTSAEIQQPFVLKDNFFGTVTRVQQIETCRVDASYTNREFPWRVASIQRVAPRSIRLNLRGPSHFSRQPMRFVNSPGSLRPVGTLTATISSTTQHSHSLATQPHSLNNNNKQAKKIIRKNSSAHPPPLPGAVFFARASRVASALHCNAYALSSRYDCSTEFRRVRPGRGIPGF